MSLLAFTTPGPTEWMFILIIVLVLFGANKLPGLARSLGQSMNEFRKAREEFDRELQAAGRDVKGQTTQSYQGQPQPPYQGQNQPYQAPAQPYPTPAQQIPAANSPVQPAAQPIPPVVPSPQHPPADQVEPRREV